MPAVVVRVLVKPGDQVRARQTLVVLEAMKMEHLIQSPTAGVIRRVSCAEGATVPEGAVLVEVGEGEGEVAHGHRHQHALACVAGPAIH